MTAIRGALASAVVVFLALTWADPDLWGHVRFGQDIVDARALPRQDPYSFTSDVRWVNHEWLAETIMAAAFLAAGSTGLILLKLSLALGTVIVVMRPVWKSGRDVALQDALLAILVAGIWIRIYVVRPQLFSLLSFAILISTLRAVDRGAIRHLVWLPALFGVWVNLHGGWIVGAGVLILWASIAASTSASMPRWPLVLALVAAAAATLVNPYGVGMWAFLGDTVRPERPSIDDWRPLLQTPALLPFWLPIAAAALYGLWHARRDVPWSHAAIVVGLGLASLRVSRLDAFFAIATVALLGPRIAARRFAGIQAVAASRNARALAAALAGGVLLIAAAGTSTFRCIGMENLEWLPEREAAPSIRTAGLEGRMITWFGWGQYAIWHLSPAVTVSFDGRRETVYSDRFSADHIRLYSAPEQAAGFLGALDAELAWLPGGLPLVAFLEAEGWSRVYEGSRSVVLSRLARQPVAPAGVITGGRCFPGP